MGLSQTKESLLHRTNERLKREHTEAYEIAERLGRQLPSSPALLTPEQIEWPRWMHKNWKLSSKGDGHYEPGESKLVRSLDELKALGEGWSDGPPKGDEKNKK